MELRVRHIARNVVFNWFGTVANMAVGFFLAPFIVHHLGNVGYGVWLLAISAVAYLGLLDLGIQDSVLRFVSKGHTLKDHQSASEAMSAALWIRMLISLLAFLLSVGLAAVFPLVFKVPPAVAGDAKKAILLIGLTTAINLSFGVFGGVISALNRYDLQNYVNLAQTAVRVVGVVTVLATGHGIVAIAVAELIAAVFGNALRVTVARRLYPELRILLNRPKTETLKQIWTYSSYAFLTMIAIQLVYQSDNIVVGAFVSAAAVTFYGIANSLCSYSGRLVDAMAFTFIPAASTYEAAGNSDRLLMLYKNGTRAMLMVALPILITLIVRGPSFIGVWMGPQYAHQSGIVLIILCIPLLFSYPNKVAAAIAFGIEKHKVGAVWAVGEGVSNLTLSIILVHWYGIYGVAIGTLVPSVIVNLGFWPRYISHLVGLSYFEVMFKVWAPMFLSSVPFIIATYAVGAFYPTHNRAVFFLQVLGTLPVFFLTIGLVFRTYVRSQILPKVRSLFFAEART